MGLWSAYFIVKLVLYARGVMDFSPWLNFGFAVFTTLPPGNSRQRFAKNLIALPVGVLLLFHDAAWPPLTEINPLYLAARIYHSFSWTWILALAVSIAAYSLARLKLRISTFVFIAILCVALRPATGLLEPATARVAAGNEQHGRPTATATAPATAPDADPRNWQPQALDARLEAFYEQQSGQRVHFNRAAADGVPYDVLIVQVASLSWDDLKTLKRDRDPLFGRFDIVFSQFNSAASDAAPAEIRLLRGGCGQTTEGELERPAPRECLILDALQRAGFEPHWLVNDAANEGALGSVRQRGEIPTSSDHVGGARVTQKAADGSPVFGDYSILSRWAMRRAANPAARVVLYYDSVTLNDGNRPLGGGRGGFPYAERVADFTADVNRFIDDLQRSGRHTIVVVMAKHGAALRGDSRQMPGLREIPTPSIAIVPVGVTLVNVARSPQWVQTRIDVPTSYLAVSELLARFVADDPFDGVNLSLERYTAALPQTQFVAENNGITVMRIGTRNLLRSPDGAWSTLDE
jgi:cellulose synthase operon protein YhjU